MLILATRIGRYLERQGLLERDAEQSALVLDRDEESMDHLIGSSITYRIAIGPQQGRKVFRFCRNLIEKPRVPKLRAQLRRERE